MNKQKIYIQSFTSLRGIAALVVLFAHTTGYYLRPDWLNWLIDYTPVKLLLDSGVAVNLFFVLSGFVLSINFVSYSSKENYAIEKYFFYRIIRICFPFWLVMFVSFFAHQYLHHPIETTPSSLAHPLWNEHVDIKRFLLDAVMIKANHSFYLIPQAWTLAIELKISLLMPLFIYFAQRNNAWLIIFTLCCILIFKQSHYVFNFCFGVLVAKYFYSIQAYMTMRSNLQKLIYLCIAACICSLPAYLGLNYHYYIYFGVFTHALGTAIILATCLGYEKILNHPWLVYIGKISYSLYLRHMLVLWIITPHFVNLLNNLNIVSSYSKPLILFFTTIMGITLAGITYHCIEQPSIQFGKKILSWYQETSKPKSSITVKQT